jgi:hypothetical protein
MLVKVCFKLNDERHVNQRVHLHHHHPIQILAKHPGNATLRIIIIMSSGGSSSNSRLLVATALGSACAGAALAVAVVKAWQRRDDANAAALQPHRPSVIMGYQSDSRNDMSGSGGTGGGGNPGEKLMPHQHEEKMRRRVEARALVEEDNFQPRNSVTVRVPATSANMGPGCTYYYYDPTVVLLVLLL